MKKSILALMLATVMFGGCDSKTTDQASAPELPVSRVVMYQSGIGYIERSAAIAGDELVLSIRPDQINDILKSLTVIDRGNGRPVSISLPVDRDTLDRLSQIPYQVREGGIRSLLTAFRGANVRVKTRGDSYVGRIVGLDEVKQENELNINMADAVDGTTVTLKNDADVLNVIAVSDIRSVELFDKSLSDGLDKSLNISLNEGNWKKIDLHIRMDSKAKREIALSYLVAMPTWKPAYRLILGDADKGTLQGWAVVSNVTGADWNDISFSLVSGQHMSFTYDLYTPQFLRRPDLTSLSRMNAEAPVVVNSARSKPKASRPSFGMANAAPMKSESPMAGRAMADDLDWEAEEEFMADEAEADDYAAISSDEMAGSVKESAETSQIGSFDEYRLASKLSVPDGNTALVNLIQSEMAARDVRLFDATGRAFDRFGHGWEMTKSYQTIELKNDGSVALNPGPITIYRDSAVIGEGYLSRTDAASTAYITFATDGRITASIEDVTEDSSTVLDAYQNGRCSISVIQNTTNHFKFESHANTPIVAQIQFDRNKNWEPVNFPENVVKNDNAWIASVSLSPENPVVSLPLSMKIQRSETYNYRDNFCLNAIQAAIDAGQIPAEDAESYATLVESVKELSDINIKLSSITERIRNLRIDQKSLTETLAGFKDIKNNDAEELKKTLIARQTENETQLAQLTAESLDLETQKGDLESAVSTLNSVLQYNRK